MAHLSDAISNLARSAQTHGTLACTPFTYHARNKKETASTPYFSGAEN
jgi:hypothetical protein